MKDYSTQFRKLVEVELPKDSRIVMPRGDDGLMILATWRLPAEPFRPAKRSRAAAVSACGSVIACRITTVSAAPIDFTFKETALLAGD